jgi:hypothetical protein
MRLLTKVSTVILGTALAAAMATGQASASANATVIPNSASSCNPTPFTAVTECTQVIGGGLKVDSITGRALSNVDYTITEVHIEIYGPGGTIKNCGQVDLAPGRSTPNCTWNNPVPQYDVQPGDYCTRVWQFVVAGYYIDLSNECINVHA